MPERLRRRRRDGGAAAGARRRALPARPTASGSRSSAPGPAGLSAAHDLALLGFRPVVFESEPVAAGHARGRRARLPPAARADRARGGGHRGAGRRDPLRRHGRARTSRFAELRRDARGRHHRRRREALARLGLPGENGPGRLRRRRLAARRLPRRAARPRPRRRRRSAAATSPTTSRARSCARSPTTRRARPRGCPGRAASAWSRWKRWRRCRPTPSRSSKATRKAIERLNGWGPVEIERDDAGARHRRRVPALHRASTTRTGASAPVYDDADRQTVAVRHACCSRSARRRTSSFLDDGGDGRRGDAPRLAEGRSRDAGDDGARRLRRRRPGARHAAADRRGGVGQGGGPLGLPHLTGHALTPKRSTAHLTLDRYRRERGYESIRRVAVPIAEPARAARASRGVGRDGLRRPSRRMREASRCLDCGVTPVFDGTRCVLCGGCVDVCPTLCLKLVDARRPRAVGRPRRRDRRATSARRPRRRNSAILKDEDRCIRCALCAMRCPVGRDRDGARHLRHDVEDRMTTTSAPRALAARSRAGAAPRLPRALRALGRGSAPRCSRCSACCACPKAAVLPSPSQKFKVTLPETLAAGRGLRPAGPHVAVFRDAEGVYAISTRLHAPRLHRQARAPRASSAPATARGSRRDGAVTKGPAPRALAWLQGHAASGGDVHRRRGRRRRRRARR